MKQNKLKGSPVEAHAWNQPMDSHCHRVHHYLLSDLHGCIYYSKGALTCLRCRTTQDVWRSCQGRSVESRRPLSAFSLVADLEFWLVSSSLFHHLHLFHLLPPIHYYS